jgi:hypothetical protein
MLLRARRWLSPIGAHGPAPTLTYDADATALFGRMASQPDATRKGLIDDLIVGAKADGWWTKLDWLVLLAAHSQAESLLNWKPGTKALTNVGATFTVDRGWTGNGSSAYLTFGETFNAAGNQFAQNNASVGAWCNLQGAGTGAKPHIADLAPSFYRIVINAAANSANEVYRVNDSVGGNAPTSTDRKGHRTVVRGGSPATEKYFYKAGALTHTSGNGCLLTRSSSDWSADRLAAAYSGGALTGTDVGNIHTRLNTFLTAIGGA